MSKQETFNMSKLPKLIVNNQSLQDVLPIYREVKNSEDEVQHFHRLQSDAHSVIDTSVYGPIGGISSFRREDRKDREVDFTHLVQSFKCCIPLNRIKFNNAESNLQFNNGAYIIPANIGLLYNAGAYVELKEMGIVPTIINYESTLAQVVEVKENFVTNYSRHTSSTSRYGIGNLYVFTSSDGSTDLLILNELRTFPRRFTRETVVIPENKQSLMYKENRLLSDQDMKYYMEILEANRLRIIKDHVVIFYINFQGFKSTDCTKLMAYDIVWQQLNLLLNLIDRGLIKDGERRSLEDLHRVFIANLSSDSVSIAPPLSIYLDTINDIVAYWDFVLFNPKLLLNFYESYIRSMDSYKGYLDGASSEIKNHFNNVRITEDVLVANPSKVYSKHPTDIPNVRQDSNGFLTYQYPIRYPYNRAKSESLWNLEVLKDYDSLKDKKWELYYENTRRPEHFGSFDTLEQAAKEARQIMGPDSAIIPINEIYDRNKRYPGMKDEEENANDILTFLTKPDFTKPVMFAISGDYEKWYALKGDWEEHEAVLYTYRELEAETGLNVAYLLHTYININGVCFRSDDLRLFYNTFLYDTLVNTQHVEFKSSDTSKVRYLHLPNMSLKDMTLMRDLFMGRVPILFFYQNISNYAFEQLSGKRTLLELYDLLHARYYMDMSYKIGLTLRQQLAGIQISSKIGKIARLEELIKIADSHREVY